MSAQYPYGYTPANGAPVTPPPSRKKIWGVAIAVLVVIGVASAACGPEDGTPEAESASGAIISTAAPATPAPTSRVQEPVLPGVEDETMSVIYGAFLKSEGIDSVSEREARYIAQAACAVLRNNTAPGESNIMTTLYGTIVGAVNQYPDLSQDDAATVIGAGVTVYCPEFDGAF